MSSRTSKFQRILVRNCEMETLKFWQMMITSYSDIYPAITRLTVACLVILMSNAGTCECVFSTQNRIKSRLRSSLNISTLDMLMRISIEGPEIEQMNYAKALEYWKTDDFVICVISLGLLMSNLFRSDDDYWILLFMVKFGLRSHLREANYPNFPVGACPPLGPIYTFLQGHALHISLHTSVLVLFSC